MFRANIFATATLAVAFSLFAAWLSLLAPRGVLFVSVEGPAQAYQLYYYNNGYQERDSERSVQAAYLQGVTGVTAGAQFPLKKAERYRFDVDGADAFRVPEVTAIERSLFATTYRRHEVVPQGALNDLTNVNGVFNVIGPDPHFEFSLGSGATQAVTRMSWDWAFMLLFSFLFMRAAQGYRAMLGPAAATQPVLAFAVVLTLALALSLTLKFDHGPDEAMHYGSFFWYAEHLRPPSIAWNDDVYLHPLWQSSYVLGASADLTYLLTARLANLLGWILPATDPLYTLRLSQLLLVVAGAGLCARYASSALAIAYMLIWVVIPQLTYTATYLNGDVLSLVFAFVACALILGRPVVRPWQLLTAVFLLANIKSNYLPLLAIVMLAWAVSGIQRRAFDWRSVGVLCIATPLIFYRRLFNFWDQRSAGQTYVELALHRVQAYTPSGFETRPLPEGYIQSVYERILAGPSQYEWHTLWSPDWYVSSIRSLFGVFGYMDFVVPLPYLLLSIAAFIYVIRLAASTSANRWMLVGCAALVIMASLYYSVSQGYQAQGRYLFPFACLAFVFASPALQRRAALLSFSAPSTIFALSLFR